MYCTLLELSVISSASSVGFVGSDEAVPMLIDCTGLGCNDDNPIGPRHLIKQFGRHNVVLLFLSGFCIGQRSSDENILYLLEDRGLRVRSVRVSLICGTATCG